MRHTPGRADPDDTNSCTQQMTPAAATKHSGATTTRGRETTDRSRQGLAQRTDHHQPDTTAGQSATHPVRAPEDASERAFFGALLRGGPRSGRHLRRSRNPHQPRTHTITQTAKRICGVCDVRLWGLVSYFIGGWMSGFSDNSRWLRHFYRKFFLDSWCRGWGPGFGEVGSVGCGQCRCGER